MKNTKNLASSDLIGLARPKWPGPSWVGGRPSHPNPAGFTVIKAGAHFRVQEMGVEYVAKDHKSGSVKYVGGGMTRWIDGDAIATAFARNHIDPWGVY